MVATARSLPRVKNSPMPSRMAASRPTSRPARVAPMVGQTTLQVTSASSDG